MGNQAGRPEDTEPGLVLPLVFFCVCFCPCVEIIQAFAETKDMSSPPVISCLGYITDNQVLINDCWQDAHPQNKEFSGVTDELEISLLFTPPAIFYLTSCTLFKIVISKEKVLSRICLTASMCKKICQRRWHRQFHPHPSAALSSQRFPFQSPSLVQSAAAPHLCNHFEFLT